MEELRPEELSAGDERPVGPVTTLQARVLASPAYRAGHFDWAARFEDRLARANGVLRPAFGVELEVVDTGSWEPASEDTDIDTLLAGLEAHDPADGVDMVIGLVGALPRMTESFRELGAARLLRSHAVLRSVDSSAERAAIDEVFRTVAASDRRQLANERKAHKELLILLHEVAHVLGATHVTTANAIMQPAYSPEIATFAEATKELVRIGVRARRDADEEVREPDYEAFRQRLEAGGPWLEDELREYIASLTSPGPAVTPPEDLRAGTLWDITPLSEPDRALYREVVLFAEAQRLRAAWTLLEPLCERHPDVYGVQELGCNVAMMGGVAGATMSRLCARMSALAREQPEGD